MTCEEVRESAAVALLMRTEQDADVTEHLAGCDLCRAELARLAPLPGLLGMLEADDLAAADPAGTQLLDRLLAAATRERHRLRTRVLAVAAAFILVLAVPLAVLVAKSLGGSTPTQVPVAAAFAWHATDPATGVSGQAEGFRSSWGSNLDVSIAGVPAGTRCTVVVVTKDGQQQTAATWVASYSGTAHVKGTVAAAWKSIAHVDIVDDTGKVLLRISDV